MKKWNKVTSAICSVAMGTMLLMFPTGTKGEESQQDTHATIVNKQEETTTSTSNSIVKESSSLERKQVKDQISDSATNSPIVADLTPFVEKNVKILVDNGSSLQIGQNQTDSAYLGSEESLSNQLHVIHSLGNGWVTIENKATGKFLTVENQAVVYTNFSGLDHQKWQFVNEQNGHYAIQSKSSTYLVRSESNEIGLSTNRSDQRWKLETSVTNETTSTNQTKTTETTAKSNQSITNYQQKSVPMNVITQTILSNSKVKITIANPNGGNAQMVQFPTWSKTNGQDDIRWLKGTKNGDGSWSVTVDSVNFKNSGEFYTHVYVTNNGKIQFLGATSYNLAAPPANIITKTVLSNSKIKITIANPNGGNAQMVQFPTWSKTNGQDDIRWLKGTKNGDGSWSVTVDSVNFKNSGEFYTHVYVTNNGKIQFLGATSYNLAAPPANIITKTVLSNSKIKITIANPNGGNAQMVQFPTWSKTNGQDDIRWLKGTKNGDGSWSVTVDSVNFKNSGEFYTHVYVTNNGKNQFLGATSYNLAAPPANIITKTVLSNSKIKITIANPNGGNAQMVQFPTWSKTNGQDDIRWLKGTKNGDGSWSVTVDSTNFKNSGEFYTHVYVTNNGKNQFLGATSYSLSMDEVKNRLAHPPFYYSQLDWRWKTKNYGMANLGAAGCVPTSMAMILKGQFGLNVTPIDTANRLYSYGGYNQQYFGASGIDFVRGMNSYGRTIMMIRSLNELNDYLSKGYAVVMFVDVGIGHAIVAHTYANGKTLVYDPYGKQFYSGYASTNSLWNSPSKDRIDWTAGRPYFAVK